MKKKAAIGLPMNILVVIIIGLVVLAGGIALVFDLLSKGDTLKDELSDRTKQEIERLLIVEGKPVALPSNIAYVNRGDDPTFGIGILNIGGSGNQFSITVELSKALDKEDNPFDANIDDWLLYHQDTMIIEEGEHRSESILVEVPKDAKSGQYIFNVKVWHTPNEDQYDNTQKLYVNVK